MVDSRDGADLRAGAAKEHLVSQIKFRAIDRPLLDLHPQFVANQLNHRAARNTFENVIRDRRRR